PTLEFRGLLPSNSIEQRNGAQRRGRAPALRRPTHGKHHMARLRERRPAKAGGANTDAPPAGQAAHDEDPNKTGKDDVHALALNRWQAGYERDRDNIEAAYED